MGIGPTLTPMVQRLMIANAVIFFVQVFVSQTFPVGSVFGVTPRTFFTGMFWQPFTYMWLHADIWHVAMNMFMLWMFGSQLALYWGTKRFLRYYLLCGVGAGFLIVTYPYVAVGFGISTPEQAARVGALADGVVVGSALVDTLDREGVDAGVAFVKALRAAL